jgi:hypothetical protein
MNNFLNLIEKAFRRPLNVDSLRKDSHSYNRKKFRNEVIEFLNYMERDIKKSAKRYGSRTVGYRMGKVHYLIAYRLFRRKNPNFTYSFNGNSFDEDGEFIMNGATLYISW